MDRRYLWRSSSDTDPDMSIIIKCDVNEVLLLLNVDIENVIMALSHST